MLVFISLRIPDHVTRSNYPDIFSGGRVTCSALSQKMSHKASVPSGMLNVYLHGKHAVAEEHVAAAASAQKQGQHQPSREATDNAKTRAGGQAVNDLDKHMREITHPRTLRKARKMQKGT